MSILIKGLKMPKEEALKVAIRDGIASVYIDEGKADYYRVIELPEHGDLIDIDKLSDAMYHEAFETDSAMQKWDSGCWIRYKMFERQRDSAPVVIPAERSE